MVIKYPLIPSYVLVGAETCIGCCLCTHVCPIYEHTKDPNKTPPNYSRILVKIANTRYAYIPRGKIDEILKNSKDIYYCTLCGACITACPFGILTPDIVLTVRENMYRISRENVPKTVLDIVESLRKFKTPYGRKISLKHIVEKYKLATNKTSKTERILLYPGCTLAVFFRKTVENIVKLLLKAKVNVVLPKEVKCCGFPAIAGGDYETFSNLVEENINEWSSEVVFLCSECYKTFLEHYRDSSVNALFIIEYIMKLIDQGYLKPSRKYLGENIVIHDPCNYSRWLRRSNTLEELLRKLRIPYVKPKLSGKYTYCCGFGGLLAFVDTKLALNISLKRVKELAEKSRTILSLCPACTLSAKRSSKLGKLNVKILSVLDMLCEVLL